MKKMTITTLIIQVFVLIIQIAVICVVVYFKEKAKNIATKQDIAAITREVESVKAEISRQQAVLDAKYELKHEAYMEALSLIDAQISHNLNDPNDSISKQYMPIDKARECHNKLILACENTDVIEAFTSLVVGRLQGQSPIDDLNSFRNLVRQDLGFGGELNLDREIAYFGRLYCENQQELENEHED